jgi:hypothetical protein
MINEKVPNLFMALPILVEAKDHILQEWLAFEEARRILDVHDIFYGSDPWSKRDRGLSCHR